MINDLINFWYDLRVAWIINFRYHRSVRYGKN